MKFKLEGSEWSQEDNGGVQVNEGVNEGVNEENEGVTEETQVEDQITDAVTTEDNVLKFNSEDEVLDFIKSKEDLYSKVAPKKEEKELPSEIKKYLEFKEETGRGYEDFINYQKDYSSLSNDELVKMYIKENNPEFDDIDINEEFAEAFAYDSDYDDERTINKKNRALKKAHKEALDYFEKQKEKWSIPLEVTNSNVIPEDYKVAKETLEALKSQEEVSKKQGEYFLQKTDELFSNEFKGFEFKIGDDVIVQKPNSIESVRETQKNVTNFFSKFLDENGLIKDAEGYHKALYVAMNYESVLKNIYETAYAKAIESEVKSSKNIDMSMRSAPQTISSGTKFKLL
jgi:hypothetical protein